MKLFVLQNPDYTELYWSSEYGWSDIEQADKFFGTELEEDYVIRLKSETNGRWVLTDFDAETYIKSNNIETTVF